MLSVRIKYKYQLLYFRLMLDTYLTRGLLVSVKSPGLSSLKCFRKTIHARTEIISLVIDFKQVFISTQISTRNNNNETN